jgi:hypothetical protein
MKTKILIIALISCIECIVMAQKDTLKNKKSIRSWVNIGLMYSGDENLIAQFGYNLG